MRFAIICEYFALWGGFVVFTVGYIWSTGGLRRGGWRKTEAGLLVAALGASCSWILTLGVLRLVWSQYNTVWATVYVVSYGALVAVVWWLISLLWRRQRDVRRERRFREQDQV